MLEDGRSRIRIAMKYFFFNIPNLSSRFTALESTQLLTEMSTVPKSHVLNKIRDDGSRPEL
jgi:hypothetical protein